MTNEGAGGQDEGKLGSWEDQSEEAQMSHLLRLKDGRITADELVKYFGKNESFYERMVKIKVEGSKLHTSKILLEHDATPHKYTIINDARRCTHEQAIMEIFDNIFDNAKKKDRIFDDDQKKVLEISIEYVPEADLLLIRENSGGIPFDNMENLVTPGLPGRKSEEETIGVWGRGFKIAMFALGLDIQVKTHYPRDDVDELKKKSIGLAESDNPLCRGVRLSREWITPVPSSDPDYDTWRQWKIQQCQAEDVPEGETHIDIEFVKEGHSPSRTIVEEGMDPIRDEILRVYSHELCKLREKGHIVTIDMIHGTTKKTIDTSSEKFLYEYGRLGRYCRPPYAWTDEFFRNESLFVPSFGPYKREFRYVQKLTDNETYELYDARIRMLVTICFLERPSRDLAGVWLYGNGKLFDQKREYPFYGKGNDKMPTFHDTLFAMVTVVEFEGDPQLIPWRGPLKAGFEGGSLWNKMRDDLRAVMIPYARFKNPIYSTGLEELFSKNTWMNSPGKRWDYLFPVEADRNAHFETEPYKTIAEKDLSMKITEHTKELETFDSSRHSYDVAKELGQILGKHKEDGSGELSRELFLKILFPAEHAVDGGIMIEAIVPDLIEVIGVDEIPEEVAEKEIQDPEELIEEIEKIQERELETAMKESIRSVFNEGRKKYSDRYNNTIDHNIAKLARSGLSSSRTVRAYVRLANPEDIDKLHDITGESKKDRSRLVRRGLDKLYDLWDATQETESQDE